MFQGNKNETVISVIKRIFECELKDLAIEHNLIYVEEGE
jgi:hypothetical protein